jgi:hypothetical protein
MSHDGRMWYLLSRLNIMSQDTDDGDDPTGSPDPAERVSGTRNGGKNE